MQPASRVSELLSRSGLEQLLAYLFEGSSLSEDEKAALRKEGEEIRDYICQDGPVFEETDNVETYLALRFSELKARWIVINATIQDFNRRLEVPDEFLTYRSSLLSEILGMLEVHVASERIRKINEGLAEQATGLEGESYVMIEGDQVIIEGKRKIVIYRKNSVAD